MQIVFAWKNAPKHRFIYRLAKVINRNDLIVKRINATYIDPYSKENILIMSIGLHGIDNKPAWEATDIDEFLRELVTLKYFDDQDRIESTFHCSAPSQWKFGKLYKDKREFYSPSPRPCRSQPLHRSQY